MPYPWSDMSYGLLKDLMSADPAEMGLVLSDLLREHGIDHTRADGVDGMAPTALTFHALCRWLKGKRSVIDVSTSAGELLKAWAPRFAGLLPGGDKPWEKGAIFRLKDGAANVMVYAEPLEDAGIRYCIWLQDPYKDWGTVLPKGQVDPVRSGLDTYTEQDRMLNAKPDLAIAEDGTRINAGRLRCIAVNSLAALHEDPRIILGYRKGAKRRRLRPAGPVARVRRLTLTYDAARLITRRWVTASPGESAEKTEHSPHATPCLHEVQPHDVRVWGTLRSSTRGSWLFGNGPGRTVLPMSSTR